jgi:trimeric autotransporter adhesin
VTFASSIGIAGLGVLLTATSSSAITIRSAPPIVQQRHVRMQAPQLRSRSFVTVTTCTSDGANSFVGIPAASNVAGGNYSAVAGAYDSEACDEFSTVAGGYQNRIGDSGAALDAFIGAGEYNEITAPNAAVVAGYNNEASGIASFIGAGDGEYYNLLGGTTALATFISGTDSFVGAGDLSSITGNGSFIGAGGYTYAVSNPGSVPGNQISGNDSFIGAGDQNSVSGNEAFIGGGMLNAVSGAEGFIGSGGGNTITPTASYATILGGNRNSVSGEYASILGGFGNSASGAYAIVAGGDADTAAGSLTFAAGYHADAGHNGSFVWSDYSSGSAMLKDSALNQFLVRASGGTYLYSNEAATSGVMLAAGSSTWASLSDRNAKTNIVPLDEGSILAKVAALPIDRWSYKSERGVRHVGPMAQDFYAAFGTGVDDRHITSIDEDGIALAAIQALHRENAGLHADDLGLHADNRRLHTENEILRDRLAALEQRVGALAGAATAH